MPTAKTQKFQKLARNFIKNMPPYPKGKYKGRGVVIPAGGPTYFIGMWVCVRMLRYLGCDWPVEVWYLGRHEMDDRMKELVKELGDVTCIDAYKFAEKVPGHRWSSKPGWELNPFCILHSRFKEVLFLDADNVPIKNPGYLFETPQYKSTGAIFWPDYLRLAQTRPIWKVYEVPYRNEAEFESGQIVLDKERCWREINLTMHYNMYSGFYYAHHWGDKETYHMAWRRLGTKYSMTKHPIHRLPQGHGQAGSKVMCQHDFKGNIVFQHRNMEKWKLNAGSNPRIKGFKFETRCLNYVKELASKWDGLITSRGPQTKLEIEAYNELVQKEIYEYNRVGHDKRHISFRPNQRIGKGRAMLEQSWEIEERDGEAILSINGDGKHTMELHRREDGSWVGRWLIHERMPIRLTPTTKVKDKTRVSTEKQLLQRRFIYRRINHDKRVMELHEDGTITEGKGTCEKRWELRMNGKVPQLVISGDNGVTCVLEEAPDKVWEGRWVVHEKPKIELIPLPENG